MYKWMRPFEDIKGVLTIKLSFIYRGSVAFPADISNSVYNHISWIKDEL